MKKLLLPLIIFAACGQSETNSKLPYIGNTIYEENDTIYHTVKNFVLTDQDSSEVTNATFDGKIYVADFFFTSCPTICPIMKKQMLRVYDKYQGNEQVAILSHTIDPDYDTVALLNDYAKRLGVNTAQWKFVTGDADYIYDLGEKSYMVMADEDDQAEGGFIHSGAFLLVDKERHIRGAYDGTEADQVDVLINDIQKLLKEYE
jgi:protein SCO1